jgi:hypothetical protein
MAIPGWWGNRALNYPIKPINQHTKPINYPIIMVRKRSLKAQERDILILEAVAGVKSGLYKTANAAAKALHLRPNIVVSRIKGRHTSHKEAHLKHQLLS